MKLLFWREFKDLNSFKLHKMITIVIVIIIIKVDIQLGHSGKTVQSSEHKKTSKFIKFIII